MDPPQLARTPTPMGERPMLKSTPPPMSQPATVDREEDVAALRETGRELTLEIVQASLSKLGHNSDGKVVYTTCNLSALSLISIAKLTQYPFLQKLILDRNSLDSLEAIQGCRTLCHVSATHNRLSADCFESLKGSVRTLEFLDVSCNRLSTLDGLAKFRFLRTFLANGNQLTTLTAADFASMASLSVLSLEENKIVSIEAGAFEKVPIRSLNLNQNSLVDLSFVLSLKGTLSSLLASGNNVMHFDILQPMQRLHTLDVSHNNCYDIAEVSALERLPLLRTVALNGNPLCYLADSRKAPPLPDDDAASDIVQPDEPAVTGGAPVGETDGAPAAEGNYLSVVVPDKLRPRELNNRKQRQDALATSQQLYASPDDDLAALTPQEEDKIQFLSADSEAQYRLRVLWRAPNITQLDGRDVQAKELSHAKKLEGGATRESRVAARSQFLTSGGSAAFALRQQVRQHHQDPPNW